MQDYHLKLAYQRGFKAAQDGYSIMGNYYEEKFSRLHSEWVKGYSAGKDSLIDSGLYE